MSVSFADFTARPAGKMWAKEVPGIRGDSGPGGRRLGATSHSWIR